MKRYDTFCITLFGFCRFGLWLGRIVLATVSDWRRHRTRFGFLLGWQNAWISFLMFVERSQDSKMDEMQRTRMGSSVNCIASSGNGYM